MSDVSHFEDPYFFKKSVLNMTGSFELAGHKVSAGQVLEFVGEMLTEERKSRIESVIKNRTFGFIPVMENIYDRGNISAVMRSAESFGFLRSYLIEKEDAKFKASNRVTRGADKWLDVRVKQTATECVGELHKNGYQVFATHLDASRPITEIDFSKPTAIVLGNEKDGVSEEMVEACDGNIIIPMYGFSQSFNISVAAALLFYHASQARVRAFGKNGDLNDEEKSYVAANYYLRCLENPEKLFERFEG